MHDMSLNQLILYVSYTVEGSTMQKLSIFLKIIYLLPFIYCWTRN
jgi:hypothetical protein